MVALRDGIQPADAIRRLGEAGVIRAPVPFAPDQVQPASLDLRLGARAYRVRASFLPARPAPSRERLEALSLHAIDLDAGAVLETRLRLYRGTAGKLSPSRTTSRRPPTRRARPAGSTSSPG